MSTKKKIIDSASFVCAPVRWCFAGAIRDRLSRAYRAKKTLQHDVGRVELKSYLLDFWHGIFVGDAAIPKTFKIWNNELTFTSYGSIMSTQAFYTGEVEYHLTQFFSKLVTDDFCFLDVGGHHGAFSCIAAHVLKSHGWNGQILVFEPDPRNQDLIQKNLAENGLTSYVKLIPQAVSNQTNVKKMMVSTSDNSANSLAFDEGTDYGEDFQLKDISTVRLDDLKDELTRVDVIKMDIQGGEYWALLGAETLISQHQPVLILEVVEGWGIHVKEICEFLEKHDYEVFGITKDSKLCKTHSEHAYVSWDWVAIPKAKRAQYQLLMDKSLL